MEKTHESTLIAADAAAFWAWFEEVRPQIETSRKGDLIRHELLRRLHQINPGLFYEMAVNSNPMELVITPQGRAELFDLVDGLVMQSPKLAGWQFLALKPAGGFDFHFELEGVTYPAADLTCRPIELDPTVPTFALQVALPAHAMTNPQSAERAVLLMLDIGLGERQNVKHIRQVRIVHRSEIAEPDSLPIKDLPRFIEWSQPKN